MLKRYAEANQREHVWAAIDDGFDAANEDRPAGPQHHRRTQNQFDPLRRALTEQITYEAQTEKRPHGQHQQRRGQNGTDQEPAPEVDQLGVGAFVAV